MGVGEGGRGVRRVQGKGVRVVSKVGDKRGREREWVERVEGWQRKIMCEMQTNRILLLFVVVW